MATTNPPGRTGRPRDADVDARILEATRAVFRHEGYDAVTISAVARAAGLPRSTVYRRYPGPVALRFAAGVVPASGMSALAESGEIRADMAAHIAANATPFREPASREVVRSLIVDALADATGRQVLNEQFVRPRLAEVAGVIGRAVERGDLPPRVDADLAAKAITGLLIYHALLLDEPVDDDMLRRLLDLLFPPEP